MSEAYIGEIRMFAGSFAPVGWLPCNGQLLPIAQYDVVYSLLGTTYGGDGQTTFGLPDLRGRMPIHAQPSFGVGAAGGSETVTLVAANLPTHNHTVAASSVVGTDDAPTGNVWANSGDALNLFSTDAPSVTFAPDAIGAAGAGQPHDNMMPFLAVTFMICLEGIYPSPS
jgi:microcystin-dependent protein